MPATLTLDDQQALLGFLDELVALEREKTAVLVKAVELVRRGGLASAGTLRLIEGGDDAC
jgi:hypothetical protein